MATLHPDNKPKKWQQSAVPKVLNDKTIYEFSVTM